MSFARTQAELWVLSILTHPFPGIVIMKPSLACTAINAWTVCMSDSFMRSNHHYLRARCPSQFSSKRDFITTLPLDVSCNDDIDLQGFLSTVCCKGRCTLFQHHPAAFGSAEIKCWESQRVQRNEILLTPCPVTVFKNKKDMNLYCLVSLFHWH